MSAAARSIWGDVVSVAQEHLEGVEWSFSNTISILRRRWVVLAASIGVCLALAVAVLLLVQPQYTASSLLQINTRTEQVTKVEDVVGGISGNDAAIRTEVDVLSSRKLAQKVITRLNLLENSDFNKNTGFIGNLKRAVMMLVFPLRDASDDGQKGAESAAMTRAVNHLLDNLDVRMQARSYSIVLDYTATTPELAAKIANSVAQEYLNSQLEDKFDATRRANNWMNDRIKQMQKSVQASELAVQKFREQHNLTEAKGVLLSEQQISELNSQLILARTQLAEAQAKYDRTKQLQNSGQGIETATEVLSSPLIMNLREQEAEVRRNMSDLASRYGERHPRMVNVRNQLRDLQRKIGEEIIKIQGSLGNNVAVAQARVNTLEEQLQALQNKTSLSTDASVQLAELERQAQAEKSLYENFLNRSKELAQMDFAQTDARIISPAEVPLSPSKPKKVLVVLAAIVLGSMLGVGLIMMLEALDSGFRTVGQLETQLGVAPLGLLGELPHGENPAHYVLDKPTGAFTEGVRAVRTAMQFANPDKPAQVVMVTSTVPQEGKSLFAISLAQLSAHGGAKVLLVDGDLRRPSVSKQLELKPKAGLAEVLVDKAKLKDVLLKMEKSDLHVLPSLPNTQFSQELLSSQKMRDLLADWRKHYDLIVIDSPPVMAVADSITLAGLSDALVFMVRWGSTPRTLVANAVRQLRNCHVQITGCVLSRVDLEKQFAYGYGDYGYYYGKYKEYYND